ATYVDLYAPTLGHDACQLPGARWVEPVAAPVGAAPVHPNVMGMIVAHSVLVATLNATEP
ncbi:MAG TPA: SGNH/GDSL hydrolase family protein, partial [Actinomycetota bacterium]|nr:SGNH/GDSL hydrolase family protein [Actinomycetota bacterium]